MFGRQERLTNGGKASSANREKSRSASGTFQLPVRCRFTRQFLYAPKKIPYMAAPTMTDWTSGYVADVGYTFGYYRELNPLCANLALLNAGIVPPEVRTACELGFGQGVSVNIHAAASKTEWHGTDFNPAQAGLAQEFMNASGAEARLCDDAFADFAQRSDLPDFDFIGLHGIWTWISPENWKVVVEFIRRRLKVGGLLYISYNTLPGWSAFVPMRHLMTVHAEVIGAQGRGIVSRINEAIDFAARLLATNPSFSRANPQVLDRIKTLKDQNRNYLAHEYFNRDWHPVHFATMAEWLEPAKVQYACSAHYLDHIDAINLTAEQQTFLKEIPDNMFRESVRDFMVNAQFRKDYWVKGVRRMSPLEQAERLRTQKIILTTHRPDVSLKVNGVLGEAKMTESVYNPLLDLLADHKPKTLGQLEIAVAGRGVSFGQVLQAALALAGSGHIAAVQESISTARKRTDKLNAHLIQRARTSSEINYLASPVTGGGFVVDRFQQLFLLAMAQGKKQPSEWATATWQILSMQGQKILKEGKALETDAENLAELNAQAQLFATKHLPILRELQIL
jgi:SAM-dependent methyltransferase